MKQENHEKSGRRAYLKDFRPAADGDYIYCGKRYALHGCGETLFLVRSGVLSCGALALAVLSGLFAGPGMDRTAYVLLPYVLLLGAAGSLAWAFFRLLFTDRPVRAYVYEGAVQSVPRRCVFTVVAAGARLAGQIVFLCLHGATGRPLFAGLDFLFSVLVIVCAAALRIFYRRADWRELSQNSSI